MTNDEKWMLYLGHAVSVFRRTGVVPSGGNHPGSWVSVQRGAFRSKLPWMTPQRQALLDEHLPGWREGGTPQRTWLEIVLELQLHLEETGRFPRQNGDTVEEQRLGAWLTTQRVAYHRDELGAARESWLNQHMPGWEGRGTRQGVWEQTARELGAFVTRAQHWPSKLSTDADERRLCTWLRNRRDDNRGGRLSIERVALLDQLAPGWPGAGSGS